MPCDTRLKPRQTIKQRALEVTDVVARVAAGLVAGKVKAKAGPTGGVAFLGLSEAERDGVTDACIYRRVMATGSTLAKARLAAMAPGVSHQALAHGHHSHDGGATWHTHKG